MSLTRDETRTVQFAQEAAARGLLEPGNPAHATYLLLNKLTATSVSSAEPAPSGPVAAVPDKPKRGRKPRAGKPATASNVSTPWGQAIGAILTKADISQAALGKLLGVSGMAVSRWLNRGGRPGEDALAKLSDVAAQHSVTLPIADGNGAKRGRKIMPADVAVAPAGEVGAETQPELVPGFGPPVEVPAELNPAVDTQSATASDGSVDAVAIAEPAAESKPSKRNRKGKGAEVPDGSGNGTPELVNA